MTDPHPPIRVILFDISGVLVELRGLNAMLRWLDGRVTANELIGIWLASPSVRAFETGRLDAHVFASEIIAEMALPVDSAHFLREFTQWPQGPMKGTFDLLKRIPAGYTRATLSNTNSLHWPRVTDEMGLGSVFDYHFASHLTGKIKPDREAFLHVTETLNCEPQSVLFLDDTQANVDAARAAGMIAFRVDGVAGAEHALLDAGIIRA